MFEHISDYLNEGLSLPVTLVLVLPLMILVSPHPARAAHEFAVYRMQHFDLHGSPYGCRNSLLSMEARTSDSQHLTRKCVVSKMVDYTWERHKQVLAQAAGAVLLLLPPQLHALTGKELERLQELEQHLLGEETNIPIYFSHDTDELEEIYQQLVRNSEAERAATAVQSMVSSVLGNGYQLVAGTGSQQAKSMPDHELYNIIGKLPGSGIEEQLPTVVVVAHYDTFGVTPGLSFGVDSNGSGVITLLELARLFSKLYSSSKGRPRYNLLFSLTAAGKFNYQGTRKWIEQNIDHSQGESELSGVSFVLCLDTVGGDDPDQPLYLHVSKPPKETAPAYTLLQHLTHHGVEMVHKKINLNDEMLSWEHERFSLRKLPAMTLSRLKSHDSVIRKTITDTNATVDVDVLSQHISVVANSLAHFLYGVTQGESDVDILTSTLEVDRHHVASWVSYMSHTSRAAQVLGKDSPVVSSMRQALASYTSTSHLMPFTTEKREPDFMFFNMNDATMFAYGVKPAVFDLFLALLIGSYLAGVYFLILNFATISALVKKTIVSRPKLKET